VQRGKSTKLRPILKPYGVTFKGEPAPHGIRGRMLKMSSACGLSRADAKAVIGILADHDAVLWGVELAADFIVPCPDEELRETALRQIVRQLVFDGLPPTTVGRWHGTGVVYLSRFGWSEPPLVRPSGATLGALEKRQGVPGRL
jgi:hypothetical protein